MTINAAIELQDPAGAAEPRPTQSIGRILRRLYEIVSDDWRNLHPRLLLVNALLSVLPTRPARPARGLLYRNVLRLKAGKGTVFEGKLILQSLDAPYARLRFGRNCRIGSATFVLNGEVNVGDGVRIDDGAVFTTDSHRIGPASQRMGGIVSRPIVIEDGAWVSRGAVIHPGVTIGRNTFIGERCVVTESLPERNLILGVEAAMKRTLTDDEVAAMQRGIAPAVDDTPRVVLQADDQLPGAPLSFTRLRWLLANLLLAFIPPETGSRLRTQVYRRVMGIPIGRGTVFLESIKLRGTGDPARLLRIGDNCGIRDVTFVLNDAITIGDRVWISSRALLTTGSVETPDGIRQGPITVGDGCWVTQLSAVGPGVEIGAGSIVGNNSVVLEDVPPSSLVAGAPGRVVRRIPDRDRRQT